MNFLIDSGCKDHMISDKSYFTDIIMLENPLKIAIVEDNNFMLAVGVGNIDAYSIINNKREQYTLKNVLYVPGLRELLTYLPSQNRV